MRNLILFALAAPGLFASAIFNAPAGCTALAPAPNVTGVQCFGSFNGAGNTVTSFSGTGIGSLWATSILFEWDFSAFGFLPRLVDAFASVNGRVDFRTIPGSAISERHTGSFTLPVIFGETLNTWQILLIGRSTTSTNIDIPTSGIGLRLLVTQQPPDPSAVPEPSTAGLLTLAGAALLLFRTKRCLWLVPLAALAPLTAAPIFTAPAGCTAIQPAPNGEGVQCYGSRDFSLEFSGGGNGPLWASEVVFEWDFSVFRSPGLTSPIIAGEVNGESFSRLYRLGGAEVRYAGSVSIPYVAGTPLTSWTVVLREIWGGTVVGGSIGSSTPTVSTPLDGVGFRFLATNQPPEPSAVPEPATASLLALAAAALLLRHAKRLALLPLLAIAPLTAAPVFTAPAGCTAFQQTPNIEGVRCYGDTGLVRGASPELSFGGSGTGPLWASEILFEWDFVVSGGGGNIIPVLALVNGESGSAFYGLTFDFTTPYAGSLRIPYTPGAPLSSWSILVQAIVNSAIGGESRSLSTPPGGLGLRLSAVNQPPGNPPPADVPEPGTWGLLAGGALALIARYRAGGVSR